jgi:hypothetical protein
MYKVLRLNSLSTNGYEAKVKRVVEALSLGDFRAAQVSKLRGQEGLYRIALDDKARLIFRLATCRGDACVLLLELLRHHEYEKSRFLRGYGLDEQSFEPLSHEGVAAGSSSAMPLKYLNPKRPVVHYLDRALSFDDEQEQVLGAIHPLW